MQTVNVRLAQPGDLPELFRMIQSLAVFEGLSDQVNTSCAELKQSLFSSPPKAYAYLAFINNCAVGYVLLLPLIYIKRAQPKLVMEDFYIDKAYRSQGIGKQLIENAVIFAKKNNYFEIEWRVSNWNQNAQNFYQRMGAEPVTTWTGYRLAVKNKP